MDTIEVTIPGSGHHLWQITTGFLLLQQQGWNVRLIDRSRDQAFPFHDLPVVLVRYRGKQVVYDMWDGYQNPDGIRKGLEICDFYFKRSFSPEKNQALFPEYEAKIYPLGFFYRVTHPKNPIQEPLWKGLAKCLTGITPEWYFTPGVFEAAPSACADRPAGILFLTQLWEQDSSLSPEANAERDQINHMRIHIIRSLRQRYGDAFLGGLKDTPLCRSMAPDLIAPARCTERRHYLKRMQSTDICIGSMGLHGSIGGKTGEYVAASRAIVNEAFRYQVPGDFAAGKHYLPFTTAQECLDAVQQLASDPGRRLAMQQANQAYYQRYLKPDMLVKNTLAQMDRVMEGAAV